MRCWANSKEWQLAGSDEGEAQPDMVSHTRSLTSGRASSKLALQLSSLGFTDLAKHNYSVSNSFIYPLDFPMTV